MNHSMYLTENERDILLQIANHATTSLTRLSFGQLGGNTVEGLRSTADVLIGLIEKGLIETDDTLVFGLTQRGAETASRY